MCDQSELNDTATKTGRLRIGIKELNRGAFHWRNQPQFGHIISALLDFANAHSEWTLKEFRSALSNGREEREREREKERERECC